MKFTAILRKEIFLPNITTLRKGNQFFFRTSPKLVRSDRINNVYAYLKLSNSIFTSILREGLFKITSYLIVFKDYVCRDYILFQKMELRNRSLYLRLFLTGRPYSNSDMEHIKNYDIHQILLDMSALAYLSVLCFAFFSAGDSIQNSKVYKIILSFTVINHVTGAKHQVRVKIRNATDLSTDDFTLKVLKEWVTLMEVEPQVNSHSYITNVAIKVKEVTNPNNPPKTKPLLQFNIPKGYDDVKFL